MRKQRNGMKPKFRYIYRILCKQKPLKWRTKCIPMYEVHIGYLLKNFSSAIFFPHLYQFKNLVRKDWGQQPNFLG